MLSRNEYCMESWQKSLEIEVCVHVCQETSGPVLCDCCAISFHQKGYCISVLGKGKKKIRGGSDPSLSVNHFDMVILGEHLMFCCQVQQPAKGN